jgi:hypothetical protein
MAQGSSLHFGPTYQFFSIPVVHLSDQHYDICFRRSDDFCSVCFTPSVTISVVATNAAIAQSSFGLR